MSDLTSSYHIDPMFRYDERWRVLICRQCQAAVSGAKPTLSRHLHNKHGMGHKEYKPLIEAVSTLSCCEDKDQFPDPLDDTPPIEGLRIYPGYRCKHCKDYKSRSEDIIKKHVFNNHPSFRMCREEAYESVSLQTWSIVWSTRYWTVIDPDGVIPPVASVDMNDALITSGSWEERMARMEQERLEDQENQILELHMRNGRDDTSPWLLFTKWPEIFKDRNIKLIAETCQLNTENRHVLELCKINKPCLKILSTAFDRIILWALDSLNSTNWNLCCWLRSPARNEPSHRPFKMLQNKTTLASYSRSWKQCLHYCFRTALLDEDTRKRVYGIEFTAEQLRLIREVKGTDP